MIINGVRNLEGFLFEVVNVGLKGGVCRVYVRSSLHEAEVAGESAEYGECPWSLRHLQADD